jgi:lipoprotein-releasing system permease protein
MPFELHLACRNLARQPWQSAAMVLGLAMAVVVMVYIPSTLSSFYDDMIDRTVEQNSPHVTVWPREKREGWIARALRNELGEDAMIDLADHAEPRSRYLNGYHALAGDIADTPGVVAVASFVQGNAAVSRGRVNMGITVQGIEPRQYGKVVNFGKHFPGNRVPELGPSDIAIGFRMAQKLGISVGQQLRVATAMTNRLLRVKAIFRSGHYEKDLQHTYVPLKTAQLLFQTGNEVSGLAVRCVDLHEAVGVSKALSARLDQKVRNWRDDNAALLAEIATVQRVALFINVLVALVASAGMANVFSMFVLNRQKELAIIRAVGSSRASLRAILQMEAAFIWVLGTIMGLTAALAVMAFEQSHPYEVSAEMYGIGSYATNPKAMAFVTACTLGALTMAMSAWWSGRRAAKLNPIDVIFGR